MDDSVPMLGEGVPAADFGTLLDLAYNLPVPLAVETENVRIPNGVGSNLLPLAQLRQLDGLKVVIATPLAAVLAQ